LPRGATPVSALRQAKLPERRGSPLGEKPDKAKSQTPQPIDEENPRGTNVPRTGQQVAEIGGQTDNEQSDAERNGEMEGVPPLTTKPVDRKAMEGGQSE